MICGSTIPAPSKAEDHTESGTTQENRNHDNKPRRPWPLLVLGIVIVLTIIGGVVYWPMTRNLESTDDVYTEGNAVAFAQKSPATSLNLRSTTTPSFTSVICC